MYLNWLRDAEEKHEFATDYSIFTGSFSNAEMAKKMINSRNPTHETSDEEFEESTRKLLEQRKVLDQIKEVNKPLHRRKRKVISDKE